MADYNVNIKGFTKLFHVQERERLTRFRETALEAAQAGIEHLKFKVPVDTGALIGSMHAERISDGATIAIDSPYGAAVELGSRPHRPPIEPLKAWALRHGMDESAAWAIAAKIEREGTKPTFFIRNNMQLLLEIWKRIVRRAIEDKR